MAGTARTVLISGCSSGIGLQLAAQLARDPRQRYQVVATMRDMEKKGTLEAAAGETLGQTLTVAQLDVCSDESVARCLRCIPGGEVDVLVNNAGVGLVGPVEGLSLPAMQNIFDTNFFGAVRLVKAVLPGMKRRRQGHIVVVSSVMGLQAVIRKWPRIGHSRQNTTPDRAGSCTPRPVFPAQLTGLSLEQKLQRGQKQAEANPRLDQTPATPHPGGPQKRRETSRCGCGARRLRRLGALARSGRLHSGSA
nr:retinol dehydrogenase 8-like [Manis javanica]